MLSLKIKSAQIFSYVVDLTLFFVSLYLALCIRRLELVDYIVFRMHAVSLFYVAVVFIVCNFVAGLYDLNRLRSGVKLMTLFFYSVISTFLIGTFIFYLFPADISPKLIMLFQAIILYALGSVFHALSYNILIQDKTKALLLGSGVEFEELKETINNAPNFPIHFVSHLDLDIESNLMSKNGYNSHVSGTINKLERILKDNNIKIIVSDARNTKVLPLLPYLYNLSSD